MSDTILSDAELDTKPELVSHTVEAPKSRLDMLYSTGKTIPVSCYLYLPTESSSEIKIPVVSPFQLPKESKEEDKLEETTLLGVFSIPDSNELNQYKYRTLIWSPDGKASTDHIKMRKYLTRNHLKSLKLVETEETLPIQVSGKKLTSESMEYLATKIHPSIMEVMISKFTLDANLGV